MTDTNTIFHTHDEAGWQLIVADNGDVYRWNGDDLNVGDEIEAQICPEPDCPSKERLTVVQVGAELAPDAAEPYKVKKYLGPLEPWRLGRD